MLPIFINILLTVNVIVCILLILLTLMQRPKNEGLGAAFGGGMTENLFGAQTTNVLAKATRVLAGLFFVLTLGLSMLYTYEANSPSAVQARLNAKSAPAVSATPAAPAASATPAK
ncbi:MAG: preprotein translocase subunit SecG [Verrucomicrobia bacterium]|nr:preprotein translocase subunit SecG [Verrucomicrobiota bacterium]